MPNVNENQDIIAEQGESFGSQGTPIINGGDEVEPIRRSDGLAVSVGEDPLKRIDELAVRLETQEKNTKELDNLIKLGWIVIVITCLGTSITFFGLIIQFFDYTSNSNQQPGTQEKIATSTIVYTENNIAYPLNPLFYPPNILHPLR